MTISSNRRSVLTGTAAGLLTAAVTQGGFAAGGKAAPVARTSAGKVRGTIQSGINVFRGVRYGADTAPRRFRTALPPKPWSGVRDALHWGNACPQNDTPEEPVSEDCLFLNVWTPALRDNGKRPVMVWLHGGGYTNGSGAGLYSDGTNLSKRGNVVVVTINHRINAFGYMYLGRLAGDRFPDSGNVGQLDIIMALQWIRENIAEFGGDPDRVLVFGQSGGGAKIATLMAMPKAKGLFHRAITMSGQQTTAGGPLHATTRTEAFLRTLGIGRGNLDDILSVSADRMAKALRTVDPILGTRSVYFGPVLDFRNLMRHPFYPDAPEQSAGIPMMIGNTHDEVGAFFRQDWCRSLTWESLPDRLATNMRVDILPRHVIARYREMFPRLGPSELFIRIVTASRSWRAAIEEDEARAKSPSPAYAYQLDWSAAVSEGGDGLGAHHGLDVPLAFDNIDKPGMGTGTGAAARRMAAVVSETFIAFARNGKPDNPLIPHWAPYSMGRRETMVFDLPPRLENDPRGAERRLFEKVPFILQGT